MVSFILYFVSYNTPSFTLSATCEALNKYSLSCQAQSNQLDSVYQDALYEVPPIFKRTHFTKI